MKIRRKFRVESEEKAKCFIAYWFEGKQSFDGILPFWSIYRVGWATDVLKFETKPVMKTPNSKRRWVRKRGEPSVKHLNNGLYSLHAPNAATTAVSCYLTLDRRGRIIDGISTQISRLVCSIYAPHHMPNLNVQFCTPNYLILILHAQFHTPTSTLSFPYTRAHMQY